jgi:hypothetical protein
MSAAPAIAFETPSALGTAVNQSAGACALSYLLPYFIGAQFGGVVGSAILLAPLSIGDVIELAITMAILLLFCWFMDLSGKLRRAFASRG